MVDFGVNPYDVSFAALVPLAALATSGLRHRLFVVLCVVLIALVGWTLLIAADAWVASQWFALMERTSNPSIGLQAQFNADGTSKTVTYLLGFPASLAYTAAWLFIGRSIIWLHRKWHYA